MLLCPLALFSLLSSNGVDLFPFIRIRHNVSNVRLEQVSAAPPVSIN